MYLKTSCIRIVIFICKRTFPFDGKLSRYRYMSQSSGDPVFTDGRYGVSVQVNGNILSVRDQQVLFIVFFQSDGGRFSVRRLIDQCLQAVSRNRCCHSRSQFKSSPDTKAVGSKTSHPFRSFCGRDSFCPIFTDMVNFQFSFIQVKVIRERDLHIDRRNRLKCFAVLFVDQCNIIPYKSRFLSIRCEFLTNCFIFRHSERFKDHLHVFQRNSLRKSCCCDGHSDSCSFIFPFTRKCFLIYHCITFKFRLRTFFCDCFCLTLRLCTLIFFRDCFCLTLRLCTLIFFCDCFCLALGLCTLTSFCGHFCLALAFCLQTAFCGCFCPQTVFCICFGCPALSFCVKEFLAIQLYYRKGRCLCRKGCCVSSL